MTAAPGPPAGGPLPTAPLARRLAAFVYEGLLLFGVVMVAGFLYAALTQQRHALQGQHGLQAVLFAVLALYFAWFWSHGGQTVAMRAWHVRLVDRHDAPVTPARALARYLAAWVWFAPPLALAWALALHSLGAIVGLLAGWVIGYALLAQLRGDRQFWHDALCGTRLVHAPPPRRGGA